MLETINLLILRLMDAALGWTLGLPKDLALILVAALSAFILLIVRRFTTDQDFLRRCFEDKKRLKTLIREARARKDKAAVQRYKQTRNMIKISAMKYEGLPTLVSLLPIGLLATWAFQRLEFHPPKANEPVEVRLYFPQSAEGGLAYLAPDPRLVATNGWVQEVRAVTNDGPPYGLATWKIKAPASDKPYALSIRHAGKTYSAKLLVGQRVYEAAVVDHGQQIISEVAMPQVKLFGRIPGFATLWLAPWLVGYLVVVIPLVPLMKRGMGIY